MSFETWVRKTITISDTNDYWFNVRSGEIPGVVYIDYEEQLPEGEKKTVTVSFDEKFADEICQAIQEVAKHESGQIER